MSYNLPLLAAATRAVGGRAGRTGGAVGRRGAAKRMRRRCLIAAVAASRRFWRLLTTMTMAMKMTMTATPTKMITTQVELRK